MKTRRCSRNCERRAKFRCQQPLGQTGKAARQATDPEARRPACRGRSFVRAGRRGRSGEHPRVTTMCVVTFEEKTRVPFQNCRGSRLRCCHAAAFAQQATRLPAPCEGPQQARELSSKTVRRCLLNTRPTLPSTATGIPQQALSVPVSADDRLLIATLIESRQTTSVADLLSTTPGVTVTRNGGLRPADRAAHSRGGGRPDARPDRRGARQRCVRDRCCAFDFRQPAGRQYRTD